MAKKLSREEYQELLKERAPEWELVGEYTNAKTRTLFKHLPCGTVSLKTPCVVQSKPHSCRVCNAQRIALTHEQFLAKVQHKMDRYEVLSHYDRWEAPVTIHHKECGTIYEQLPAVFIRSKEGCPHCVGRTISKSTKMTHTQFLERVADRLEDYDILTEYKGAHQKIKVRHKACGNEFWVVADNFVRKSGCNECRYSTGEGELCRVLKGMDVHFIQSCRTILPNHREIDIYLPSYRLGFEYDGLRYHSVEHFVSDKKRNWSYAKSSQYHLWKTKECYKQGIRLIHIFEDEWLEHPEIVKDKIRSYLKLPMSNKYFARKLQVREITNKDAKVFLDANHIQGNGGKSVAYGLFDDKELVAVQAFARRGDKVWELTRYATKLDTQVVGGFTKCLKHFEQGYNPKQVYSFADRRWCSEDDNVYQSCGFTKVDEVPPNYWYIKGQKRYHKFNFRKSLIKKKHPEVYAEDKTERQMMREAGYQRIYDCGLIKYIKEYK